VNRRRAVLAATLSAACFVAGCSTDDTPPTTLPPATSSTSLPGTETSTPTTSESPVASTTLTTVTSKPSTTDATTTTTEPLETLELAVYFIRGDKVALAHETVPRTVATTRAALEHLFAGPGPAEMASGLSSSIPSDAELIDAAIANRIATIAMRGSFDSDGLHELRLPLAQIVYTVTQFPTVDAVVVELNGSPVEVVGTDGVIVDHPLSRADFEEEIPAIFVDGPAPLDEVDRLFRVHGTANVFEATFMVRLTDADGQVLYEHFQMATSGTGTRGTFDFTLDATMAAHGTAMLRLWEPSANDGSDTNVVEIPVVI
jgi:germination protein M